MDRAEQQAMANIARAVERVTEKMGELNKTMARVNTNLVQIGQNMKEDRGDAPSTGE